ncbi:homocysteine S-methyltransferase family protein [Roseomonas sp. SSH11]|uniref:Homocysteine S-methyltransferase family protein n=1 Tax=Pararoseomonas baculiformis TaxID=2820812 RepID=A0ABS4AGN7_9PROT|nr:homocysteine S-methyltransferase family protein [Pararoseomonas baculiformis]MBP0446181.1 homocysteine S-methyltransferase family protein [Pararoseomonas baculiformis]
MARYRDSLPQLGGETFLTDGGLETTLIFHEGLELPEFAAFVLLETEEGRRQLRGYLEPYLRIAREKGLGFVLDTPTWRANPDWGAKLGYDAAGLRRINMAAVRELIALRETWETPGAPLVVSGAIGPRGDGYKAGRSGIEEAERYHAPQIAAFAEADADMVGAFTLTGTDEAAGIARAAAAQGMPCSISFTVETDGRLVDGTSLRDAIATVDAETGASPAYYLINCAHPTHFELALEPGEPWMERIRGIRANASAKSHAELDESDSLDIGDPEDLARRYRALRDRLPRLRLLGGCCGTDHRHVRAICEAWLPA